MKDKRFIYTDDGKIYDLVDNTKLSKSEVIDALNDFYESEKRLYDYFLEWFDDVEGIGFSKDFKTLWESIKFNEEI